MFVDHGDQAVGGAERDDVLGADHDDNCWTWIFGPSLSREGRGDDQCRNEDRFVQRPAHIRTPPRGITIGGEAVEKERGKAEDAWENEE